MPKSHTVTLTFTETKTYKVDYDIGSQTPEEALRIARMWAANMLTDQPDIYYQSDEYDVQKNQPVVNKVELKEER